MKTLEQQKKEYGVLWDRYALELFRFGCFLTGERERTALCLEQAFLDGWKKRGGKNLLRLRLYRSLWMRCFSLFAGQRKKYHWQAAAALYLIHIQHLTLWQTAYVVGPGFLLSCRYLHSSGRGNR